MHRDFTGFVDFFHLELCRNIIRHWKYGRPTSFILVTDLYKRLCLHCFDAVGWAEGRTSGLLKTEWGFSVYLGPFWCLRKQSLVMTVEAATTLWPCSSLYLEEVRHMDVKIQCSLVQCLVQFIRMWHRGLRQSLLSIIVMRLLSN